MSQSSDERWMGLAVEEAGKGLGLTRPNPPVGAVVIKRGRLISHGFHAKAGGPHAELVALQAAGDKARNATLYVTLEPCSTQGRTPPCTEAIIRSGIRRVVVSARDPNPKHRGRGFSLLRKAGVEVEHGLLADAGRALIEPFTIHQLQGRPFVTLKMGMSLDGKIADRTHASKWITGAASRKRVQALRRQVDGVLVGVETVLADNPSLIPRPAQGRKPWRIVLDSRLRISPQAKLLTDPHAKRTLLYCSRQAAKAKRERLGAIAVRSTRAGLDPKAVLNDLGGRGLLHVLCEGGGQVAESLFKAGLVDECWFFIAPKLLGGGGHDVLAGAGWSLPDAPELIIRSVEPSGEDLLVIARPA